MLVVDLLLLVILLAAFAGGLSRGFLGTLGGLLGLVVGGVAAFWLVPPVNDALPSSAWRGPLVVVVALALPLLGASLGGAVGRVARRGVDRTPLRGVDRVLGGVANLVVAAIAMSFVGSALVATGSPVVAPAIASSSVLRTIDRLTPAPVSRTLAQLRNDVLSQGLPTLDALLPGSAPPIPDVNLADPALVQASRSVARIAGTAYACGISSTGSGFVVAPGRVITNAHVVAGVDRPLVEVPGQRARQGRIVYLDPANDLAVIAVDGLTAPPLPIVPTLAAGSVAVVQGYPYGGPLTSGGAKVISVTTAPIPDIYGQGSHEREVYSLAATVRPGNSGGPLLTTDGKAAGIVFARADQDPNLGFAMTTAELMPVVAQAESLRTAVSSGACTR
ncbi:MAG: serine protease [Cellulomonas sp. 73-92]|uniref:MarP family serine protease n=1 Tax=Cellulomonas sp. 73-92 TaxID=1895740 RepID=UPI00092C7C5C|nr:MarP family serine protease [Cellulomonas sp. 73-92]OJV76730.1 MAG: serine protease [Cellulomonas sp. 73-92]